MKEFKVNNLISLRLIDGKTVLFVDNREFKQCKSLLINLHGGDQSVEEMKSIDGFADNLKYRAGHKREYEYITRRITEEEEFMGHCSNLQAWVENGYNTELLHRNLAFPLLKKLSEAEDKLAEQRFIEEIARRYKYGNNSVQSFLFNEGYLDYLTFDDILNGVLMPEDASFMERTLDSKKSYKPISYIAKLEGKERNNKLFFSSKKGMIEELEFQIEKALSHIPSEIEKLKKLERFYIYIGRHSDNIFKEEFKSESIKHLTIICSVKDITIPDMLYYFPNLRWLRIEGAEGTNSRPVVKLENSFKKLHNLETLELYNVRFDEFPETIVRLKNLSYIDLTCTSIKSVPLSIIRSLRTTGTLRRLKLLGNKDLIISEKDFKALKKNTIRFTTLIEM